jgi:hypothetical protein
MALYLTQGTVTQTPKAQQSVPGAIPAREWYQNTQTVQLGQSAYAGLPRQMSCRVVTLNRDFKNAATRPRSQVPAFDRPAGSDYRRTK